MSNPEIDALRAAIAARRQQGMEWGAGPRDEPRPTSGNAARLERAVRNFQETFPLFVAALFAASALGKLGALTLWGTHLYVWARIAYTPAYLSGIKGLRSIIWNIGFGGLVLVTLAIFTFLGSWNDFLWPLIVLQSPENLTLTVGLQYLQGTFATDQRMIAAGTMIAFIPIAVIFAVLQRFFFKGVEEGGVKG